MLKTSEAILGEIWRDAAPAPVWPSINADGVEDVLTHTLDAGLALERISEKLSRLCAIEFLVAAQGVELRGTPLSDTLKQFVSIVRSHSASLQTDRQLGKDIDSLGRAILEGAFGFAAPDGAR